MKKSSPAVFFLLLILVGISSGEAIKGPKIAVKELRVDLGRVAQGAQVSHIFEIINEGTEPLVIQKVQPG